MELRVIIFYGLHQPFHHDSRFQFLPNLTLQSLLRRLSIFYLSAREFPSVLAFQASLLSLGIADASIALPSLTRSLVVAISSLSGEDTAFVIVYDCSYDFYLFHYVTL